MELYLKDLLNKRTNEEHLYRQLRPLSVTRGGLLNDSPRVGCPSSLTRIVRIKCRARDLLESPKISEISFCGEKQGTGSAHQVIRRETGVPEGPSTLPSDGWLGGTGTLSAPRGPCAGAASASELSNEISSVHI